MYDKPIVRNSTEHDEFLLELMLCTLNTAALRAKSEDPVVKQTLKNQELLMISQFKMLVPHHKFNNFWQKYDEEVRRHNEEAVESRRVEFEALRRRSNDS